MSHLLTLSQDERDALLSTIVYVDKPRHFFADFEDAHIDTNLVNYSFIYEGLKDKYPLLMNPNRLRSGDCVQTCDYRGVGNYYAIWLRKDLITHDQAFLDKFAVKMKFEGQQRHGRLTDEQYEAAEERSQQHKRRKTFKEQSFPTFVSRKTDGPHNDGEHDLYLSSHPDEMGYSPSIICSSLPTVDYFDHLEGENYSIDPLLTHSKSENGETIQQAKQLEQFVNDDNFPLNYIGFFDANMGDEVEWIPLAEVHTSDYPLNYIAEIRDLMNRHFDPTAEKAVMQQSAEDEEEER